jgi:uncharacterized protein YndB with AHSA1/START domain
MPDILHRVTIDAPAERVHELVATTEGIARWWTGRPLDGSAETGSRFSLYFGDADQPAAVMRVVADTPGQITWRVEEGPDSWVGTVITFTLRPHGDDGTTLLFSHAGWREASEFMSGCSTNWGAYLTSLKGGVENGQFAAYPHSEISRWD